MFHRIACACIVALCTATTAAFADNQQGVALTVYNNNFGVVQDTRTMKMPADNGLVRFTDVAKLIDPTSVHFTSLSDPTGTTVLEQNYEYDLVSADKLLDKYIDQRIAVLTLAGERFEGKLMSFDGGQLVLAGDNQLYMIQRQQNVRNIEFSKLPDGLLTRPTLVWKIATNQPGDQLVQVTYQTAGLSWAADYTGVLNGDDTRMDFAGWVTLNNRSGVTYKDAKLKLIAGDVRKIQPPQPMLVERRMGLAKAADAAGAGFAEQSFFEYHLYTLQRATTVADNQVKQVELLTASSVPVVKRYVFEPEGRYWHKRYGESNEYKVNIYVELTNNEASHLGMPLPKGKVRLYKTSGGGGGDKEFIGEDMIDHTPRDEKMKLYVGDAFDVVGEKTVTDTKQGPRWYQESVKIELRNHKDTPVTILVREHNRRGGTWSVYNASTPFRDIDAMTREFEINVAPNGTSQLTFTSDYRW
ncbi:MAG: DUF4139 domain-containing protein [Phycisphaerales bacterium]